MENRVRELISKSGLAPLHQEYLEKWVVTQFKASVEEPRNGHVLHSCDDTYRTWLQVRGRMAQVTRWGPFVRKYGVWAQNVLQHTESVALLANHSIPRLRERGEDRLDYELLELSFKLHDIGEIIHAEKHGDEKEDVLLNKKNFSHDVQEYCRFDKEFRPLPRFQDTLLPAYLLQACLKPDVLRELPYDAQEIAAGLRLEKMVDILFFQMAERFDYTCSAAWQFILTGHRHMMANVMKNKRESWGDIAKYFPSFADLYWTAQYEDWCEKAAEGGDPNPPAA